MSKAIQVLESLLCGIRGGALTAGAVDTFKVPYYGQMTPIKHLAHSHDEAGKVVIVPFDSSVIPEMAKALCNAGLSASVFSKTKVVVSANALSGGQQEKVISQIKKMGEESKISVRNIRKQARQQIDADLPKDDRIKIEAQIQDLTSLAEAKIEEMISCKIQSLG